MSASLINRSLTTIRTELDFLRESGVISDQTFNSINAKLPEKYDPYAKNRLSVNSTGNSNKRREYMVAIYPFKPQQDGDLELRAGDKIEVLEKPSPEWFKGRCDGRVGMFPSNYVKPAYDDEKDVYRPTSPVPPQYNNNSSTQLAASPYQGSPYPQQPAQQYQPPQQAYYQPPPPQQVVVQPSPQPQQVVVQQQPQSQPQKQSALSSFGNQLASAAVFGAGATIGSDIVNSIF